MKNAFRNAFGLLGSGLTTVLLVAALLCGMSVGFAKAQIAHDVWGAAADSSTLIPVTFTDATGALTATDATPTITIRGHPIDGGASFLVTNSANMTALPTTGMYAYRFVTDQSDSAGVFYTAEITGAVSGISTGVLKVFRRSGLEATIQSNIDFPSSGLAKAVDLAVAQADLDNPTQYHVSLTTVLANQATLQADLDNPDQYKATGFATSAQLVVAQADLDNPDQYKATGFAASANVDTIKWFAQAGPLTKNYTYPNTANRPDSVYITRANGDTVAVEIPTFDARGRVTQVVRKNK